MDDSANWSNGISVPGCLFMAGFGVVFAIVCARLLWFRQAALARGLTAEAFCVETFVTKELDSDGDWTDRRHMILAFRTRDGAYIELDRTTGAYRTTGVHLVGDVVPVRYLPEHPERAVVVAPGAGAESIGLGCGVALGLIFTCAGLFTAAVGFGF